MLPILARLLEAGVLNICYNFSPRLLCGEHSKREQTFLLFQFSVKKSSGQEIENVKISEHILERTGIAS